MVSLRLMGSVVEGKSTEISCVPRALPSEVERLAIIVFSTAPNRLTQASILALVSGMEYDG